MLTVLTKLPLAGCIFAVALTSASIAAPPSAAVAPVTAASAQPLTAAPTTDASTKPPGLMLPAPRKAAAPRAGASARASKVSPYHGMKLSDKARNFYPAAWGVDQLHVSSTSSGNLIRFSFRVVQPKLAKELGDHEATPYLFAPRSNAMLQVPTMEKIGQLRQLGASESGKDYWMVFSNKGKLVRPGERVNVIIGKFHADGLVVE